MKKHIVHISSNRMKTNISPHHDNKHLIHKSNTDSSLFHHIIMNAKPFSSYKIITLNFSKVRLFYKNCLFPIYFTKRRHSCSNASIYHIHI